MPALPSTVSDTESPTGWTKQLMSVACRVVPAAEFYVAEDYHQEYFARNPLQGYCTYVVGPKVAKFRKLFSSKIKS